MIKEVNVLFHLITIVYIFLIEGDEAQAAIKLVEDYAVSAEAEEALAKESLKVAEALRLVEAGKAAEANGGCYQRCSIAIVYFCK